jgi:Mg2+ and Co2+ transporter CorA
MPSIFYEIFNDVVKLNEDTLEKFLKDIQEIFKELKKNEDIDDLKVLRNKLESLVLDQHIKIEKDARDEFRELKKMLREIDETVFKITKKQEKDIKLIDVVKSVEKKYKECKLIPKEKKDKFQPVCVKKADVEYEKDIIELQLELVKLQRHIKETGQKLLIIFEGRDAAGKG